MRRTLMGAALLALALPLAAQDIKLPSIRRAAEEDLEFFKQKPVITISKYLSRSPE